MYSAIVSSAAGKLTEVEFRSREFGSRVYDFVEAHALGADVTPTTTETADERHVMAFLDSLSGDLHVEKRAVLPLEVDGERMTIFGNVDLAHETLTEVEIVDYKTDRTSRGQVEYRKQLSAYYHVLSACFPKKPATGRSSNRSHDTNYAPS